ncbi:MAG: lipase family protein [Spirochaetaceae bacterium]|nr:MAG: lipase family protein [Spirochaetaceae bacterium]
MRGRRCIAPLTMWCAGLLFVSCVSVPVTPRSSMQTGIWDLNEELLYRYWAMAEAAWREQQQFRNAPWELDYFSSEETATLAVAIHYDDAYHIAFRATHDRAGSPDQYLNLYAVPRRPKYLEPDTSFRAHSGYLLRYESIRTELLSRVFAHRDQTVILVGASAGGALATLAFEEVRRTAPDVDLRLITYSSPRVLTRATREMLLDEENRVVRVVYSNDIVPALPPALFGYRHLGSHIQIGKPRGPVSLSVRDHHPRTREALRDLLIESGVDRGSLGY